MIFKFTDSIATFFQVSNGADASRLKDCFTENAVVRDEHRAHQGHDAILAWLLEARRKYAYHANPLDAVQKDASVTVRAEVAGNFPGSPVLLDHVFRLAGDKIEFLEIHS